MKNKIEIQNLSYLPSHIMDVLNDFGKFSKVLDDCYNCEYFNLKEYHISSHFPSNPFELISEKDWCEIFGEKHINPKDSFELIIDGINTITPVKGFTLLHHYEFQKDLEPEFYFICFNGLNYIFNGTTLIPCSKVVRPDEEDRFLFLYFVPKNGSMYVNGLNRNYFDVIFYRKVFASIATIQQLDSLSIELIDFFRCSKNWKTSNFKNNIFHWILETKFDFEIQINKFYEYELFDFITSLYLLNLKYIEFSVEKLLKILFNRSDLITKNLFKLADTSNKIITESELIEYSKSYFTSSEQFLRFFKYELIEIKLLNNKIPINLYDGLIYLDDNIRDIKRNRLIKYDYQEEWGVRSSLKGFRKTFLQEITRMLRTLENDIRVNKGFKIVGSFTNESILYNQIKTYFKDYLVISQGSPVWLGRQRIDIYFPDLNIGIEYQGEQHSLPIEYFGGEEGLKMRLKLDKKKKDLSIKNGCVLIEVFPNYDIDSVIKQIENTILSK
jgi:hypothetical protein